MTKMRTEVHKRYKKGFTLNEQELRRIHDVAFQQMKQLIGADNVTSIFRMRSKNNFLAEKNSIDEIIVENNGGEWEIQQLTILVLDKKELESEKLPVPSIRIVFEKPEIRDNYNPFFFIYPSIYSTIRSEDRDWVYITSSQIEDRLLRVQHFSLKLLLPKVIRNFIVPLIGTLLFLLLFLIFFIPVNSFHFLNITMLPTSDLITGIIALFLFGSAILTSIYFFPPYNFDWGDYRSSLEKKHSRGKFILTVIIIGIIINVVAAFISAYIISKFFT